MVNALGSRSPQHMNRFMIHSRNQNWAVELMMKRTRSVQSFALPRVYCPLDIQHLNVDEQGCKEAYFCHIQ
jgi:hypothetical protein